MMTILLWTHKPKLASAKAYSRASVDFIEFICPPSDQPKGLGRGYFFDSVDKIVQRYA
jgi:hypothetical protein